MQAAFRFTHLGLAGWAGNDLRLGLSDSILRSRNVTGREGLHIH
jgi:hypothetical protein